MPNKRRLLVLLLLACLAVGGTLFQSYRFELDAEANRAAADVVEQQLVATDAALTDVRYDQAGYVAAGQNADTWMGHFTDDLARVEAMLRERQQTTASAGALTHYDAAIEQLGALRTSDGRARNYVKNDQLFLASDVIFVESFGIIEQISQNVASARDTESFESRQALAQITLYRQALGAGGLILTLLVGIVFYAKVKPTPVDELPHVVPLPNDSAKASDADSKAAATTPATARPAAAATPAGLVDAADVCVDLARLLDGRDLPALLSRAASAIGAKGLVLWVIDESGQQLRATMGHGYSDRIIAKLGRMPVSGDNVTAMACRTLKPQVVPAASADSPGAVAVPLIGTVGCVGVLAAEIEGTEKIAHQLPIARLIAAQLSAVIQPEQAVASQDAPKASTGTGDE